MHWFDDYEIAFDTHEEAEACMRRLGRELAAFRLRLNPTKTKIIPLPQAAEDEWQQVLVQSGRRIRTDHEMVKHFDTAFRLREKFPDSPILLYALGISFGLKCPTPEIGRVAQSCLTQALLCEPG